MNAPAPLSLRETLSSRPRFFIAIFLAAWISFLVHYNPMATGSDRFVILMLSLVEEETLRIDAYRELTTELAIAGNHWYLNTNPGMSFLAAPSWALLQPFLGQSAAAVSPPGSARFVAAHLVGLATTTALFGALTCVLIAAVLLQVTGRPGRALLGAALYGFGSIAFFFSTRLQQNVTISCLVVVVWVLLRENPGQPSNRVLASIGFLLGLGLFVDLSIVPLGFAMLLVLARERHLLRSLLPLALGTALPLVGLAIYQQMAFGHPIWPAQAYIPREGSVLEEGVLGLTLPSPARLAHQMFSPGCGLFVFMPWALLALLPGRSRARLPFSVRESTLLGACCVLYLLWVSILPSFQYCLYGPRYLLPIVPMLVFLAILRLDAWPRLGGALLTAGFLINLAGAQIGVPTDNAARTVALYLLRGPWLPVVDWLQSRGPDGPEIVTPYGLLMLWAAVLAALWLYARAEQSHHAETGR